MVEVGGGRGKSVRGAGELLSYRDNGNNGRKERKKERQQEIAATKAMHVKENHELN